MIILGLVLLVVGAELLVRGAARLAAAAGVSPLVVGLTVVAFGTSSPELAVSVRAALGGQGALAVGNVVGSNIFNILLILGVAALVTPLAVSAQLLRLDVPVMIGASLLTWLLAGDGAGRPRRAGPVLRGASRLSGRRAAAAAAPRLEGALLLALLAGYTVFLVVQSRRESRAVQDEFAAANPAPGGRWLVDAGLAAAGLVLLVIGAGRLVDGAVAVARGLGVSELVIGLTVIAAGTSLPEAVTSVVASLRGQRDIAVGNVVGSNIFNLLAVLGAAGVVSGVPVSPEALRFDIPVMTAVAAACLPIFLTGRVIARWEGALFLGCYGAYTAFLVLVATRHAALVPYGRVMLVIVLPLVVATIAASAWRDGRRRPGNGIPL